MRWRERVRDFVWRLAFFDFRDRTFEELPIPAGYAITNSALPGERQDGVAYFDFALDQRTLVGSMLFEGGDDEALGVWDLQTGEVQLKLPAPYANRHPKVSPDGRIVTFGDDMLINLETEEVFAEFTCQDEIFAMGAPPVLNRTGHYRVGWPFGEPEPDLDRMRIAAETNYQEVYSPDGSTMLFPRNGGIEVWDIESGARVEILQPGETRGPTRSIWPVQDCRYLIANGSLYGPAR
jgi:WD40 repeat protein